MERESDGAKKSKSNFGAALLLEGFPPPYLGGQRRALLWDQPELQRRTKLIYWVQPLASSPEGPLRPSSCNLQSCTVASRWLPVNQRKKDSGAKPLLPRPSAHCPSAQCLLPWQSGAWQYLMSVRGPTHSLPPLAGEGWLHLRDLVVFPSPPQVNEQGVHGLQWEKPPSTGQREKTQASCPW